METNELTAAVVDAAYHLHRELGPGLLETVYEVLLADALVTKGIHVERQIGIPIRFQGKLFDEGFRADLIVENRVIVEVKSIERLAQVHKKQVATYLRFTGISVGLLINFGGELLKGNIERIVMGPAPDLKGESSA